MLNHTVPHHVLLLPSDLVVTSDINPQSYMSLRTLTIKYLHRIDLDLYRTQEGTVRA